MEGLAFYFIDRLKSKYEWHSRPMETFKVCKVPIFQNPEWTLIARNIRKNLIECHVDLTRYGHQHCTFVTKLHMTQAKNIHSRDTKRILIMTLIFFVVMVSFFNHCIVIGSLHPLSSVNIAIFISKYCRCIEFLCINNIIHWWHYLWSSYDESAFPSEWNFR